ncbi:MAG: 16S rRNA (adenine(1518)-N(6)/adenine(1519)-N(6))-dimethyltransferase RsmA [Eubacterium sp.]|nr:16S rRNA (adenine(1518)-N(6)/adenine(1519)-N(6))-dimethyltransferase RsmA [Eubacterium sp.]MDE6767480.1 16S rRNA (adenine(1518)-N(6)/adenine(1519)-N(6))-dimethyltransferase RsmA [Eubacterium sp.]
MNLYDYNTVKRILSKHGFTFSKALGQNFLINPDVCPQMADSLCADGDTGVLEVGPGIGVLTKELCSVAGKVVSVELDKRLFPVLDETLAEFDNLEIINADVMKIDLKQLIEEKFSGCTSVKVCANLPYYITSPVIMTLLESRLPIDEIVVMVQKEAGERLCAEVGSRLAGAVTVAVNYYADSEILFDVNRDSFMPSPKVDSVVIRLKIRKEQIFSVKDEKKLFTVVKCAFSQRRKTALNSISNTMGISKDRLIAVFDELGLDLTLRAEKLTMNDFICIADRL